jgi:hypothetical protein
MRVNRIAHYRAEVSRLTAIHLLYDSLAHARLPEFFQVIRYLGMCLGTIWHIFEERTDLISHFDELLGFHKFTPL